MKQVFLLCMLSSCLLGANARGQGDCTQGAQRVVINGLNSPLFYTRSYVNTTAGVPASGCTVTVYLTGTTTLAKLSTNSLGNTANPFTASATGHWFFEAIDGQYDVMLSGAGIAAPFTIANISLLGNYIAPLPSAVPRPISDRLADVISVKDFGARCDGATDDTAAITTAINATARAGHALYIPGGTCIVSPTRGLILPIASNLSITGAGRDATILRVKDASGDYSSFFGPYGAQVSNFSLSDLTIDQNTPNNPIPNTAYLTANPRMVIGTRAGGTNLVIRNVRVTNTEGINTFYSGTANTSITDCRIELIGGSGVIHDYSALYIAAEDAVLSNNTFKARTIGSATAAIETHGGRQTITGNQIDGLANGMNITGVAPVDSAGIVVSGNSIVNAAIGMFIWGFAHQAHTTGFGVDTIAVTGNSIRITQNNAAYSYLNGVTTGIALYPAVGSLAPLAYRNVLIADNAITFDPDSTFDNNAGFGIGYWDATGRNTVDTATIKNNTVLNSPMAGIRWSAKGQNIEISGNHLINPASSTGKLSATYRAGIYISATAPIPNLRVTNNDISDNHAVTRMVYGIELMTTNTANILCQNNMVSVTGDAAAFKFGTGAISNGQRPMINDMVYAPNNPFPLPAAESAPGSTMLNAARGIRYRIKENMNAWTAVLNGTAPPTTGRWNNGDIMWNDSPVQTAGTQTILGWINVNTGSPGTWLPIAATDWNVGQNIGAKGGSAPVMLNIREGVNQTSALPFTVFGPGGTVPFLYVTPDGALVVQNQHGSAATLNAGRGSPEGVITAQPGSIYQNAAGGANTSVYFKVSGTGNTGWKAVATIP